jgi:hypothetical protein
LELHGFSIDGFDLSTSALPAGWRDRLIRVQNATAPGGDPQCTSWCRDKDRNFVAAIFHARLIIDREAVLIRLPTVEERYRPAVEQASPWPQSLERTPART